MKLRRFSSLLLAFPALSPLLAAQDMSSTPPPPTTAPAAPAAQPSAPAEEKKTDLDLRMDKISKAFRKLRNQVADPTQNASSLQLIGTMQAAAKEALTLTPEKAQDIPADQQAKFMADYQAGIKQLQDLLSKLQDDLTAGKNDDAVKIISDLRALEKKDHQEFRRPEKD